MDAVSYVVCCSSSQVLILFKDLLEAAGHRSPPAVRTTHDAAQNPSWYPLVAHGLVLAKSIQCSQPRFWDSFLKKIRSPPNWAKFGKFGPVSTQNLNEICANLKKIFPNYQELQWAHRGFTQRRRGTRRWQGGQRRCAGCSRDEYGSKDISDAVTTRLRPSRSDHGMRVASRSVHGVSSDVGK